MTEGSKVECPACGKFVAVTKDRRLRYHLHQSGRCEGSGNRKPTVDLLAALQASFDRAKESQR